MTDNAPKTRRTKTPLTKQLELFLEDWPDRVRGVPNVVLRSALFSISKKRDNYKKLTLIASNDGLEIRRRGEQFNQDDLDVWQVLVHLARKQPLNTYVRFTVNSVLTELGLQHGGAQHNQLREAIARLMGGPIEIRWVAEGKILMDTLIKKSFYDEKTETYVLILSEELLKLYKSGWTQIDWEERKKYKSNSLARWLHGFYSTHAQPFDYGVETLKHLCGSAPKGRLTDFRKALKVSLDLMVKKGSLVSAEIHPSRDVVQVVRIPSESQKRHLARRAAQADAAQISTNEAEFNDPNFKSDLHGN